MQAIFFSRNLFFPSSKQKLFSFLHIVSKNFFSERSKKNFKKKNFELQMSARESLHGLDFSFFQICIL